MILDVLENADRYESLHPLFPAAFSFLRDLRPASLRAGTYPIRGEQLYAIVAREESTAPTPLRLEAHRNYIDLQVALEGEFPIGWRPLSECGTIDVPYSEKNDVVFYSDPVACSFPLTEGTFALLYPEDAHAPGAATRPLLKVVVKIAVTPE